MTRLPRIPEIERGELSDIEVGAQAWSTTHVRDTTVPRGGTVVHIDRPLRVVGGCSADDFDETIVTVIEWSGYGRDYHPELWSMLLSDVSVEGLTFHAVHVTKEASMLFDWLGRMKSKDRSRLVEWAQLATQLAMIGSMGSYTPNAQARYEAAQEAKRNV